MKRGKMYGKEDFSVVNRFDELGSETDGDTWEYGGEADAIRFMADKNILLGGFALFGARGKYTAELKVFDIGLKGRYQEIDGEILIETGAISYECGADNKYPVLFDKPIQLTANRWYVAWAEISGPPSDYGKSGRSKVTTGDQIVFYFKDSKKSSNCTKVSLGQIPQLLYRKITPDSQSISNPVDITSGSLMTEPVKLIGKIETKESHEEMQIEWTITDFSSLCQVKGLFTSPNFTFYDDSWAVKAMWNSGYIYLWLQNSEFCGSKFSVEYDIGVKYLGGYAEPLCNCVMKSTERSNIVLLIELSKILECKSVLASSDVLIIMCTLKRIDDLTQPNMMGKSKSKKLIKLNTLSENFKNLFTNKESCDAILNVKDKEFKAHRSVLIARSSVFASMFLHETSEKQTGIANIPDCDPDSFEEFLEFLYCGKLEKLTARSALHLYETSDKYDVQELKTFSRECLKENLTAEIFCEVAVLSDTYDDVDLLATAQYFFNSNLSKVFATPEWQQLMKNNCRLANKLLMEMAEGKSKEEASK